MCMCEVCVRVCVNARSRSFFIDLGEGGARAAGSRQGVRRSKPYSHWCFVRTRPVSALGSV